MEVKNDLRGWVYIPPILATLVLVLKFFAWKMTGSLAFKLDALESLVNVSAALIASFLISWSRRPPDEGHPWGHGKFEYLISLFEGVALTVSAFWILNDALFHLKTFPDDLRFDLRGLFFQWLAAGINFGSALLFISLARRKHSPALRAQGLHWLTDVGTSAAGLLGMGLVKWTGDSRWDLGMGVVMAFWLMKIAYDCLRPAIEALMDQEDESLLVEVERALQSGGLPNELISIHGTKCRNFGSYAQIEWHIVLPEYLSVKQAHHQVDAVEALLEKRLKAQMGKNVFFVSHIDPCLQRECAGCRMAECSLRKMPMTTEFVVNLENLRMRKGS